MNDDLFFVGGSAPCTYFLLKQYLHTTTNNGTHTPSTQKIKIKKIHPERCATNGHDGWGSLFCLCVCSCVCFIDMVWYDIWYRTLYLMSWEQKGVTQTNTNTNTNSGVGYRSSKIPYIYHLLHTLLSHCQRGGNIIISEKTDRPQHHCH